MAAAVAALLLFAGACTSDNATAEPPTADPTPAPTETAAPQLGGDWVGAFELTLPNGWTVRECEGERMQLCVFDGEVFLGDVELATGYPAEDADEGADPHALLVAKAEDFLEHFRDDRSRGCAGFSFTADAVTDATVGGQPAVRTGFTLTDRDGRVVERVINHYLLHGQGWALVNTDAYVEEGGCLGPSDYDPSFAPEKLATFEPYLDALVAATPLPAPALP